MLELMLVGVIELRWLVVLLLLLLLLLMLLLHLPWFRAPLV